MSLRIFHVIFVTASVLLCAFVTVWATQSFLRDRNAAWIALAALFVVCGIALVVYGRKVFRKLKELG
jgi:drug/metabolite transporter (DMT)-like permease